MIAFKKFIRQFLGPEKRMNARFAASKSSQCFVKTEKTQNPVNVYLHDVSESGIGFFFKSSLFEVGEHVEIYIENEAQSISTAGQIASQRIYYPENTSDLKYALFRYSIHFQKPLDISTVNGLKTESTKSAQT